jgi:hypothetical protein
VNLQRLLGNVCAELLHHFELTEEVEEQGAGGQKQTRVQKMPQKDDPLDWLSVMRRIKLPEVRVPELTTDQRRAMIRQIPSVVCACRKLKRLPRNCGADQLTVSGCSSNRRVLDLT